MIKFADQMEFEINIRTTKNWNSIDEAVDEYVALYNSGRAVGIIFMPAHGEMDEKIFERLFQDYSVNIAVLSTSGGGKKYPTVYMDGYSHMESALDFIVSKGYKEIYYISLKYNDKSHARLKAYSDYLKKGKTKGGFLEYKDFYRNKEELWNLVKPIIDNQKENIAFACWNDVDAINLLELLNIYKVEKNIKSVLWALTIYF